MFLVPHNFGTGAMSLRAGVGTPIKWCVDMFSGTFRMMRDLDLSSLELQLFMCDVSHCNLLSPEIAIQ